MGKKLSIILLLSWRNVWKNKRRTTLTMLTVLMGTAMIIFNNSWATGGHEQIINDSVSANIGHIQIHEKGFWDNKSIDYAFKIEDGLIDKIKSWQEVDSLAERIHAAGLLSFKNSTSGAYIQGIDPESEKRVSNLHTNILPGGRFLSTGDVNCILIGKTLAKNLKAKTGDSLSMISQGLDGSIAAETLKITGIFSSGNPEYDGGLALIPLERASDLFTMMGHVNSIVIKLKTPSTMESVITLVKKNINKEKIEVLGWNDLMPEIVQFIQMDDFTAYIFDFILFMVVAFGMMNTIQMSIFERIRELGIMLAIGTRPGRIISMVLFESVFITIMGLALGLGLGYLLSYYFMVNPIDFSGYSDEMSYIGVSSVIFPTKLTSGNVIATSLIIFIISIVFSIFPALRASRLKPVEAIKHL